MCILNSRQAFESWSIIKKPASNNRVWCRFSIFAIEFFISLQQFSLENWWDQKHGYVFVLILALNSVKLRHGVLVLFSKQPPNFIGFVRVKAFLRAALIVELLKAGWPKRIKILFIFCLSCFKWISRQNAKIPDANSYRSGTFLNEVLIQILRVAKIFGSHCTSPAVLTKKPWGLD